MQSLLDQTYRNIRVIVVNDGDPAPPWQELSQIRDPRLVRFSLRTNRGPYFATEVVLRATSAPYLLIQDADDWSAPRRVECLLRALQSDQSDLAVSAEPQFVEEQRGRRIVEVRWSNASGKDNAGDFVVHHRITSAYKYRAPHHGLFSTSALRAIGGYYAGLRISFDTLIPNLILMIGRISHVPDALYYRLIRKESLTHGANTGVGSPHANREKNVQRELYDACFAHYRQFTAGRISAPELSSAIRRFCAAHISQSDKNELSRETERLVAVLQRQYSN